MKNYLLFFLILNTALCFSQKQKEKNKLIGTQILTESNCNFASRMRGYDLINLSISECQSYETKPDYSMGKFQNIEKTDSSLNVGIKLTENCCFSFLGEIEIVNDSILNFIFIGYGAHCACDCCFGIYYNIKYHKELFDKHTNIKYLMINRKKETLVSF